MITFPCRKCGSSKLHKNGHTSAGQQKDHCQACGFYGTLQPKDEERAAKWLWVEKLQRERLSQRAIARLTGLSRSTTIIKRLKKSPRNQTNCRPNPPIPRTVPN